jgi:hypothetical protein
VTAVTSKCYARESTPPLPKEQKKFKLDIPAKKNRRFQFSEEILLPLRLILYLFPLIQTSLEFTEVVALLPRSSFWIISMRRSKPSCQNITKIFIFRII